MSQSLPSMTCERCGGSPARRYVTFAFEPQPATHAEHEFLLCVRCAREERRREAPEPGPGLTRRELIERLDAFFAASGVFEICARCHEQGTGCCPPTCRVMGSHGCDPNNKRGKTVFCAAFVCGALLNAISECDPEIGRTLRWVKKELGPAEFHIYEMITRVPAEAREPELPLRLPSRYPEPEGLDRGERLREALLALAGEVLEIRRLWQGN